MKIKKESGLALV